ncbi:MAG: hypothetical protein KDE15_08815 [Erythrobacter sp.]|nr:hypothetical protein [Erythrobacter sp.]
MTHAHLLHRSAGSAIAAALALASIPALAQQADPAAPTPESVVPLPPVTVTPEPVLISPIQPAQADPVAVPLATPDDIASTVTAEVVTPEPARAEAAPERAAAARRAAPAPAAAAQDPVAADPVAPAVEPEALPVAAPAVSPPSFTADDGAVMPIQREARTDYETWLIWLLGGLSLGGVAMLGLIAASLRRRTRVGSIPRPPVQGDSRPPQAVTPPLDWSRPRAVPMAAGMAAGGLAMAGASVPLPRSKPASVAERTALIDRLAAAQPDRANPFRAPKARRRRARLIVQSLDRRFRNGSWIDFSQYPANWPHLAHRPEGVVA